MLKNKADKLVLKALLEVPGGCRTGTALRG